MAVSTIALVTDSTNDLPAELIAEHQISVVPLTIVWDKNQYLDGVDLKREDFYAKFAYDPGLPSTLPPRSQSFLDAYNMAASRGASRIIAITMTSAMSGTFESAQQAAQRFKVPVTVVDSRSTSMSMGFQLLAMARAAEAGAGVPEITQAAARVREVVQMRVALDTLDYLIKGGRVTGIAKRIGNILKLKPQLRFNTTTGNVDPGDITTSREKAIEALFNSFCKSMDKSKPIHLAVRHNLADEEAQALAERVIQELKPVEVSVGIMSPVLGTHAGPHALSLCGYAESW